jgi:GAF domain-containing protein
LSTERAFETIVAIAARTFDVPVAVLSLVHDGKVRFAAHHGVPDHRMPALESICSGASTSSVPLIVEDAATDPRVMTHELVTGEFGLRFYAGIPVRSAEGTVVGTLCVVDSRPRTVAANELATLHDLAGLATVIRGTEAAIESASA